MSSMVTTNKDAAKIWAEIEKVRNVTPKQERGQTIWKEE